MDENYDDGGALLNLGLAYQRQGDKDNALTYLKRTIELYPNTENAQEAQNALDTISQGKDVQTNKTAENETDAADGSTTDEGSAAAGNGITDDNTAVPDESTDGQ